MKIVGQKMTQKLDRKMTKMNFEKFLNIEDYEMSQYQLLFTIKNYRSEFRKNKLYPGLSELSELNYLLKDIERKDISENYCQKNPYNLETNTTLLKIKELGISSSQVETSFDFIEWAKPYVSDAYNEGRIIYDFVKRNFSIEEISRNYNRNDQGYFLVPDNVNDSFVLYQYAVSFTNDAIQKRFLNASELTRIPKEDIEKATVPTILELFKKYRDMHKSTVYVCSTDLDFPFVETLLPVAKRKLISRVIAWSMESLNIDLFLYGTDFELSQYLILSRLNKYKGEFQQSKIFPGLIELTELSRTLVKVIKKRSLLLNCFSIPVIKVDEDKKIVFFNNFHMNNDDIERIFELMKWALPEINKIIEEGLDIKRSSTPDNASLISI